MYRGLFARGIVASRRIDSDSGAKSPAKRFLDDQTCTFYHHVALRSRFRNFKRYSSLFLEFFPQLLFLILLFLYMTALMFIKWILYDASSNGEHSTIDHRAIDVSRRLILDVVMCRWRLHATLRTISLDHIHQYDDVQQTANRCSHRLFPVYVQRTGYHAEGLPLSRPRVHPGDALRETIVYHIYEEKKISREILRE